MALEYPSVVRRYLMRIGFDIEHNKASFRGKCALAMSSYFCIQTINSIIINWDNLNIRFQSIDHFFVSLPVTLVLIHYTLSLNSVRVMLKAAEEMSHKLETSLNNKEVDRFVRQTILDINTGARLVYIVVNIEKFALSAIPIIYVVYQISLSDQFKNQPIQYEFLLLPLSYGKGCSNMFYYIFVFATQIIYISGLVKLSYCYFTIVMFGIRRVTSEATIFTMSIKSLDDSKDIKNLKYFLRKVVNQHNELYRSCKTLNDNIGITITILNYGVTFVICLSIYSFVKVNNSFLMLKYFTQGGVCTLLLYLYSLNGQKLKNQSDEIFDALVDFTWFDKPKWFKKNYLLILTKANIKMEAKPFGLYVVDLRNFALVMNAAYSYFNIFKRLS